MHPSTQVLPGGRALAVLLFAVVLSIGPAFADDDDDDDDSGKRQQIPKAFDVAEIGSRFAPDDDPFVEGLPAYGNSFVTQGYIYPAGTLQSCGLFTGTCQGVTDDGKPQWPDLVIGTWTCFGWHVQDAATATTGASVVTTQIYEFSEVPGQISFVSDGFELTFGDSAWIRRAVTGGTGPLAGVEGQIEQSFLGFPNPDEGVNLTFRVRLKK